ncbi:unnamed protein product [Lactuca virosa]|uniref:Uncharacterized protein n=1 Tax=Lactuca virosa TaxID=75947 RepID=A0AAU9PL63_9ASTR|nr:unnamed protein product [Lactuca virosa]
MQPSGCTTATVPPFDRVLLSSTFNYPFVLSLQFQRTLHHRCYESTQRKENQYRLHHHYQSPSSLYLASPLPCSSPTDHQQQHPHSIGDLGDSGFKKHLRFHCTHQSSPSKPSNQPALSASSVTQFETEEISKMDNSGKLGSIKNELYNHRLTYLYPEASTSRTMIFGLFTSVGLFSMIRIPEYSN